MSIARSQPGGGGKSQVGPDLKLCAVTHQNGEAKSTYHWRQMYCRQQMLVNYMHSVYRGFWKKRFKPRTPHPSNELTKTAKEASHADAGITDSNATDLEVVQRENEDCASRGKKSTTDVIWSITLTHFREVRVGAHRGAGSAMVAFFSGAGV